MVLSEKYSGEDNVAETQYNRKMGKNFEIKQSGDPSIGAVVKNALINAQFEDRILHGLSAVVNQLKITPERGLFCLTAPPKNGDAANHMLGVLLEAFCYENDIYIIKIDCEDKLRRLLKLNNASGNVSCALIQRGLIDDVLSAAENALIDFCEACWDEPEQPVVKLPEK